MKFFGKYYMVISVGAFMALTCIYNSYGENYSIFWNTFIKTYRELFYIFILFKLIKFQDNTISILFTLGAIAVSFGYMLFRFVCAIKAIDYTDYMSLMADNCNRLIMSIVIFLILATIKYLNWK